MVSRHFLENPLRKWPGILHVDVSWASSELSRLWSQFVDFSNFGTILTSWNGSNLGILVMLCEFFSSWCPFDWNWSYLGFPGIIRRTCGRKCRGGSGGIFPTLCVEFCLVLANLCYSVKRKVPEMLHLFMLDIERYHYEDMNFPMINHPVCVWPLDFFLTSFV